MPSCLVDLSTELQLNITEELLRTTDTEDGADDATKEGQKTKRNNDLVNWSCTSTYFRNLLTPYIFKTVELHNNDKSGSFLQELGRSRYNKLVKELHFVGSAPGDAHSEDAAFKDTIAIFPESVNALLSDLRVLPNLETVSIKFGYHFDNYSEREEGFSLVDEEESDQEVKEAEEEFAWRALMAKTYDALIRNEAIEIEALEIKQLPPRKVSTFSKPAFRAFLGRLERFSLSIYGEDMINKNYHYGSMMSKLDELFFNHLTSVTSFVLKAPEEGPLGLEGWSHIRLAVKKGQMPLLKGLYLEYIFVCPELIEFLLDHRRTLEHITMHNCFSSFNGLAEKGIHWNQLFNALADANPERLRQLKITPMRKSYSQPGVPLTQDEACGDDKDRDEKVTAEVKEARKVLQADPSRRLFAHNYVDDQYGMLIHDVDENLASFQRGEDQASYERLMRIVNANSDAG